MTTETLMAQAVADLIGATKRQVQVWSDAGAIQCLPGTDRQGRGRKRLYDLGEVRVAAVVAELVRWKMPIGDIAGFARAIRSQLSGEFAPSPFQDVLQRALDGEGEGYLVLTIGPWSAAVVGTAKDLVDRMPLSRDSSFVVVDLGRLGRRIARQ